MKPVLLPAAATRALPRWIILSLALLYILPGLIGRDPWKNEDATNFGIVWTMANGHLQDWFNLNIAGLDMPTSSPLSFWLAALCIKLFGGIFGDAFAARIFTAICFLIGSLSIWYATYLLGRRSEAQPLQLAFGGQPSPQNYGRTLADGAFLIYLGCFGLLMHSHDTTPKTLQIALLGYAIYSAVRLFDEKQLHRFITTGIALGLLILTYGWVLPLSVLIGLTGLSLYYRDYRILAGLCGMSLPLALCIFAAWPVSAYLLAPETMGNIHLWRSWNLAQFNWPTWNSIGYYLQNGAWFTWPAWPLAIWALYTWREQPRSLHIALPVALIIPITLQFLLNIHSEEGKLLPLLPPLCLLAAFALPTMKRGAINAVDWFAVLVLSLLASFIWLGWLAVEIGWPEKLAHNAGRLSQGYQPEFNVIAFIIAALTTIAWGFIVHWRLSRHPAVLWRTVVLSAGGVILCWVLLMTLWLPVVNYAKSYASVTHRMMKHIPDTSLCVTTNVGSAQRASFAYFGKLTFSGTQKQPCSILLLQDSMTNPNEFALLEEYTGQWKLLWEGRRASDRFERFRLYERIDTQKQ